MLGDVNRPCLHAKGGESQDLVAFATRLCYTHAHRNDGFKLLATSGSALMEAKSIFKNAPKKLGPDLEAALMKSCVSHLVSYRAVGGHMVPKHHEYFHLCKLASFFGNPSYSSTWNDESENGLIKKMFITIHSSNFEISMFERLLVQRLLADARNVLVD